MKTTHIDCIAMKRQAQEAIRAQVCGMTREEEIAYFREGHEELEKRIIDATQQLAKQPPRPTG